MARAAAIMMISISVRMLHLRRQMVCHICSMSGASLPSRWAIQVRSLGWADLSISESSLVNGLEESLVDGDGVAGHHDGVEGCRLGSAPWVLVADDGDALFRGSLGQAAG
ncbi:hypothetical protein D3C80_1655770 [compost metagenome]